MIRERGVTEFYIGHQGAFDRMAAGILKELAESQPQIRYSIVLAYLTAAPRQGEVW